MANVAIHLFVDKAGNRLVLNDGNASEVRLPRWVQGDNPMLYIYILDRAADYPLDTPFSKVDPTGLSAWVGLGVRTPATGGPAVTILQNSFAVNATQRRLEGRLNIGPTASAALLGSLDKRQDLVFEIKISEGGEYTRIFETNQAELVAEMIEGATDAPTPEDGFLTQLETDAKYVWKYGEPGHTITMISPNGAYARILGVNDDGSRQDDVYAL